MVKPLSPWQYELLLDNEAQSNDATTKRVKLPRDGHIALLDIIIKCTNGATSNAGYSNGGAAGEPLVDAIDEIKIVGNGSKELLNVTNVEDLIAEATRITGKSPMRTVTEAASGVQAQHIPIYAGRYPDDKLVVIPNGNDNNGNAFWDSLELLIKYSPTIAATSFATGTFTITVGVKKLVDESPPESKLVKIFKKKWDYTTVASGDEPKSLTYGQNMSLRSLQVYCYEAGIAEGVDITHMALKLHPKGGTGIEYGKWRWEQLQAHNAQVYQLGDLSFMGRALCSDTDVISSRVPKITHYAAFTEGYTVTKDLGTTVWVETLAGDQLTLAVWTQADAAAVAYATDQAIYWNVKSDVLPRYAYIDFDENRALVDLIDTGRLSDMILTLTNGGAGGTVRVNEEHIMTAKQFKAA